MNEAHQKVLIADSDIKQLQGMNARFVDSLDIANQRVSDLGTLNITGGTFALSCHGHKIAVKSRPVAIQGKISALEYDFSVRWGDESISILQLYLQPNGTITSDPSGSVKFQGFDNSYIKLHLLAEVSRALLLSPVFAPKAG